MFKNYTIIIGKLSTEPLELRLSEDTESKETYSIEFDESSQECQLVGLISAKNMCQALTKALEIRRLAISSGVWDIIYENYKRSIFNTR